MTGLYDMSNRAHASLCARVVKYSLENVSPRLAAMRNTSIPMPGVGGSLDNPTAAAPAIGPGSGAVTIAGFKHEITVLPTKTRPKKLSILGSDGATYTYLIKVGAILGCIHSLPGGPASGFCEDGTGPHGL